MNSGDVILNQRKDTYDSTTCYTLKVSEFFSICISDERNGRLFIRTHRQIIYHKVLNMQNIIKLLLIQNAK